MTLPAPPQSDADRALIARQWLTSAAGGHFATQARELADRLEAGA